jgi:hypothetical protein
MSKLPNEDDSKSSAFMLSGWSPDTGTIFNCGLG